MWIIKYQYQSISFIIHKNIIRTILIILINVIIISKIFMI